MITVIDLNIGNLENVLRALRHEGAELKVTRDKSEILDAEKLILPGVGAFGAGMQSLHEKGLTEAIRTAALEKKIPLLGICVGMQLFASRGFEKGNHEGLDLLPGTEVRIFDQTLCKTIPHTGWNNIEDTRGNPLFQSLSNAPDFYFVHSYHMTKCQKDTVTNSCEYGEKFVAAFAHNNIFGAQFHPEKSQTNGLRFLRNFIEYA